MAPPQQFPEYIVIQIVTLVWQDYVCSEKEKRNYSEVIPHVTLADMTQTERKIA